MDGFFVQMKGGKNNKKSPVKKTTIKKEAIKENATIDSKSNSDNLDNSDNSDNTDQISKQNSKHISEQKTKKK